MEMASKVEGPYQTPASATATPHNSHVERLIKLLAGEMNRARATAPRLPMPVGRRCSAWQSACQHACHHEHALLGCCCCTHVDTSISQGRCCQEGLDGVAWRFLNLRVASRAGAVGLHARSAPQALLTHALLGSAPTPLWTSPLRLCRLAQPAPVSGLQRRWLRMRTLEAGAAGCGVNNTPCATHQQQPSLISA